MIITPEHLDFYPILHSTIPPGFSTNTLVVSADTGLLRPATEKELMDYVYGGEYDEVDPFLEEEWHNQI